MVSADGDAIVRWSVVSIDPIKQQYPQLQPDFPSAPKPF